MTVYVLILSLMSLRKHVKGTDTQTGDGICQDLREIYNIDYYDMSNYNLVIESTNAAPADR